MDPVILANILTAIAIIVIGGPLAWLVLRWAGRAVARKRARQVDLNAPDGGGWDSDDWPDELTAEERRQVEPDNCGDQGGHPQPVEPRQSRPKAPETGSGLLVRKDEWEKGGRAEFFRASRSARADRPQDF